MPSPVRPPQAARVAACTRPYGTRLATLGSRTQVRDPFALLWRSLAPDGAKWPQVRAQMGLCGTVTGWSAGKSPGLPWIRVRGAPQPTPRHPLRGPFMGSPARTWGHFAPFRSLLALPPGPIPLGRHMDWPARHIRVSKLPSFTEAQGYLCLPPVSAALAARYHSAITWCSRTWGRARMGGT